MFSHDLLPIIAFMARNRQDKELIKELSGFLYRKQKENFNISPEINIDYDKIGKEVYKKLEESIQKEANKKQKKGGKG